MLAKKKKEVKALLGCLPNTQDGGHNHDNNKTGHIKVMAFVIIDGSRALLPFDRRLSPVCAKFNIESNLEKRDKVAGPADTDYLGTTKSALLISANRTTVHVISLPVAAPTMYSRIKSQPSVQATNWYTYRHVIKSLLVNQTQLLQHTSPIVA